MKGAIKKAIQVITLAVFLAGGSVVVAGGEELDEASMSNTCYYGYDCLCDLQRRDRTSVAKLVRDKDFNNCTNPLCFERVNREYRERLVQIEADYQLCCHGATSALGLERWRR